MDIYQDQGKGRFGNLRRSPIREAPSKSTWTSIGLLLLVFLSGCAVSPVNVTSNGQLVLVLDEQGRLPSFDLECGEFQTDRRLTNCQAYLFDPTTQQLTRVSSDADDALITEAQPIPGSDRLLSVRDGDLYLEGTQGNSAKPLLDLEGQIRAPRVSPNGQWVALSHLRIEGGLEILSDPDKAVIQDWSLQVRSFADTEVSGDPFSLADVVAHQWVGSTLWALTLTGRSRDQLGEIEDEDDLNLALQRVTCAEEQCSRQVHWRTPIPAESVSFYAGIPVGLAPSSFLGLNPDTRQAWVVAMAAPPSDENVQPHRRRVSKLMRVDLSTGASASEELVRWNAFHPTVAPDDTLAYWAPSGMVTEAGHRSRSRSSCLTKQAESLADELRCLEVGTAIYQRHADGSESRLTPKLAPLHLLLSQTFWISDRTLGYVGFETQPSEESGSSEVTIVGTRLKAIDTETGQTTNLSHTIQSILEGR